MFDFGIETFYYRSVAGGYLFVFRDGSQVFKSFVLAS